MTVIDFNTEKGIYLFKMHDLDTEYHSHPAIEIILVERGSFQMKTEGQEYTNLKFAVIDANKEHRLYAKDCDLRVLMVEHHSQFTKRILQSHNVELPEGYYQTATRFPSALLNKIQSELLDAETPTEYDPRIADIIDYVDNHELDYRTMLATLKPMVNLSESRISHLFKANVGLSLKKYLVWSKLRNTIKQHLDREEDLFSALIRSGFYDQPHFSNTFKSMLGINPTRVYNSRTLQG